MPLTIPAKGASREDVLARLRDLKKDDADFEHGRTFSLVYWAGEEHHAMLEQAHALFAPTNALNPMAFSSLRRMEAEAVRMCADMLQGDPQSVGTLTSGGTESILMAVKSSRDRARVGGITKPNMVAPETIHVAFDKAAHYLGVELRYAKVGADFRADVRDLTGLVDANTVLIAASAPQYPHGVIDPIARIASFAAKRSIPMHVDACIGGFVLPWLEKLGEKVPSWDFRVPGVTSISADLHKYGFAGKGASVIVYRSMDYLRHQFFVSTDWPGGIYASPSMAGTRPGGAIAAAWAALISMGEEGYLSHTQRARQATTQLFTGIESIPELEVLAVPDATLLSWTTRKSSGIDVYALADRLEDRDWLIDRQQSPKAIHNTMTSNHLPIVQDLIDDIRDAVHFVRAHPEMEGSGNAAMYGMMAKVPFRGMVKKSVLEVMEKLYGPDAAAVSFDPMAESANDGLVARVTRQYGGVANRVFDRLDDVRTRLLGPRRRR